MKKLKLIAFCLIGLIINSCSSDEQTNDNGSNFSGLLKRVEIQDTSVPYIYEFKYNDNNTIDEIFYYNYFTQDRKDKFYYDTQGKIDYVETITLFNNQVSEITNFDYNSNNLLTNQIKTDTNGDILNRFEFFYSNGRLNCYDICLDSNCNYNPQFCYDYDTSGNPSSITHSEDEGLTISQFDTLAYDNNKNPFFGSNLENITYTSNPALAFINNSNNNIINRQVTTYYSNGNIEFEFEYNYTNQFNQSDLPIRTNVNEGQSLDQVILYEYY